MRDFLCVGCLFGLTALLSAAGCRFVLPISDVEEPDLTCGNGTLDPEEGCDPGAAGDPGCDTSCHVLEGWDCAGSPSVCAPNCGDGLVVAEGECEGQVPEGVTCESTGHGNGTLSCAADCRLDYSGCIRVMEVGAGADHSCARLSSGRVACWGANRDGQVGDGTTTERLTAVLTRDLEGAAGITLGDGVSCAPFDPQGEGAPGLACWGDNRRGQLALGPEGPGTSNVPVPVPWFDEPTFEAAPTISGLSGHLCAAVSDGTAACWGANDAGQIGDGQPGRDAAEPVVVAGLEDVVAVCAGVDHSCALLDDAGGGLVMCWGGNDHGQLGDGTLEAKTAPVAVAGRYRSISCGEAFTCAITVDGELVCWGSDGDGRLGIGGAGDSPDPVSVVLPVAAAQIACGLAHACARLEDGSVQCWGRNWDGQLGDGTNGERKTPVPVSGLAEVDFVSAGHTHTCAAVDGSAWCWGANDAGQLGDGTHRPGTSTPQIVLFE